MQVGKIVIFAYGQFKVIVLILNHHVGIQGYSPMTDTHNRPCSDFSDLRRQAEAQLEAETVSPEELSPVQCARLIHELQVHQIELELQNEELLRVQLELTDFRDKYVDLYDFAPVGYLTLNDKGQILEANLTAASFLGVERSRLLDGFFPLFLVEADRRGFRQLLKNPLHEQKQRGEFRLQNNDEGVRTILLDILFLRDTEGRERRRLAMTDITEIKRIQEELLEAEQDYRIVADFTYDWEFWINLDGTVRYTSPSCERISGYQPEEFLKQPSLLREIILPEDRETWDTTSAKPGTGLPSGNSSSASKGPMASSAGLNTVASRWSPIPANSWGCAPATGI